MDVLREAQQIVRRIPRHASGSDLEDAMDELADLMDLCESQDEVAALSDMIRQVSREQGA